MPPKRKIERISETWRTPDGLSLRLYTARVRNPKGGVLLVHGFAEHAGRYEHVVDAICQAGYNTFRFDLRGHGKSEGARGAISSFDDYLNDLKGVLNYWREHTETSENWAIIGHSLGGLITARFIEEYPNDFKTAVLASPFLGLRLPVPAWKRVLAEVASKFLPSLSLPSGIDPSLLSHDKEVVEAYKEDPLVFTTANARWFTEVLRAHKEVFERADRIKIPVLVMQAADDMLVNPDATRRFYELLDTPDKDFKLFDHCYHELFQELNKKQVINEVINWLKNKL